MVSIEKLLEELDERTIAKKVGIPNDQARMSYSLQTNTVESFDEFSKIIGDYYNHHFSKCISLGGKLSDSEATGRAKEILESEYRRRGHDIVTAFNDAHDGTNGGMRNILDTIADRLKDESVERYMRNVFDRHIAPNAWDQKVEIIRQLIDRTGVDLGSSIDKDQPERYAHNYMELIRAFIDGLKKTTAVFRRF